VIVPTQLSIAPESPSMVVAVLSTLLWIPFSRQQIKLCFDIRDEKR